MMLSSNSIALHNNLDTLLEKAIFNFLYAIDHQDGIVLMAATELLSSLIEEETMFNFVIGQLTYSLTDSEKQFIKDVCKVEV